MNAERLRDLIALALTEHDEIKEARATRCLYSDRVALAAEDQDHQLWRVWIGREPLK